MGIHNLHFTWNCHTKTSQLQSRNQLIACCTAFTKHFSLAIQSELRVKKCICGHWKPSHLPSFLRFCCRFTATRPPNKGGRAKLGFICLVRSAVVDRKPSTAFKPSIACCTLHCSTLFTYRLLSLWDALVSLSITFPSEQSVTLIALNLVNCILLGCWIITSEALESLLVGISPPWPRHWGFIIPLVLQCLYHF